MSREIYGRYYPHNSGDGEQYQASFYGTSALRKEAFYQARALSINMTAAFVLDGEGRELPLSGYAYPLLVNIPSLAREKEAERWSDTGYDALLYGEEHIPVRTEVEYELLGRVEHEGREAVLLEYHYPLRMRPYELDALAADTEVRELFGKLDGQLLLFQDSEGGSFAKERFLRRIITRDGVQRDEEGFRLIWREGRDRELRSRLAAGVDASNQELGEIRLKQDPEGLVLELPDIHFAPDTAVMLEEESGRLDELAGLLSRVPDKRFLVIGHTADIGTKESQQRLSVERAHTIINELENRGMDPARFLFDGKGGEEPVGDNSTEAGRRANRRVELMLLD